MALNGIPISEDQCIGDSLLTINEAFITLDTALSSLSSALGSYATNAFLSAYATVDSLSAYTTRILLSSSLVPYARTASLSAYALNQTLSAYATNVSLVTSLALKIDKPTNVLTGQVLTYNGATWVAANVAAGTTNLVGDVVSVGSSTTYNNVVPAIKGGAGTINGIMKANGVGIVTAAVAGTDYVAPVTLGLYATVASLSTYATVTSLTNYATNASLANYATIASLSNYATVASLANYATLTNLTTKIDKPSTPMSGQVLTWNGTTWIAANVSTGTVNLLGDITSTGANTTYNNVVPANKGGAGTVNGLLKANGSGTVSAAVAGTDYVVPGGLDGYIPKPTVVGTNQVLTYNNSTATWVASAIPGAVTNNVDNAPIGSVCYFAASAAPVGYLECNGAIISKSQYNELWLTLGNTYTSAVSADHFRLPDLRGEFIRGWDNGRGVNTGRVFGSNEKDEFKSHTHEARGSDVLTGASNAFWWDSGNSGTVIRQTLPTGGSETRPRNVALLPCIKALKTVTGSVQSLNFIEKPAGATEGQLLTYNSSTASWVAGNFKNVSVKSQTGTSYTIVSDDAGCLLTLSNASPITLLVPTNSTTAFPIGTQLMICQVGTGQVTVAGATPATTSVNGNNGTKTAGQYAIISLIKIATELWVVGGDATI